MAEFTDSVIFVWRIAAIEAFESGFECIDKEHLFIAICQIIEYIDNDKLEKILPNLLNRYNLKISLTDFKNEFASFKSAVDFYRMDPQDLRRKVGTLKGKGNFRRGKKNDPIIHRGKDCKACFLKAEEMVTKNGACFIYPQDLLMAIFLQPGRYIEETLKYFNMTSAQLIEMMKYGTKRSTVKLDQNQYAMDPAKKPFPGQPIFPEEGFPFLERFGRDITALAKKGTFKPLIGRKKELREIVFTLLRREKNNPVLIGEAGVGKTAIVEGLAFRIGLRNIDRSLWGNRIIEINFSSVVEGTKYRGEFEERLNHIIKEAISDQRVILFFDEIHTMAGAGAAMGGLDAADILKPVLAKGLIRIIGATTPAEYRRYIERDPALERRFHPIILTEPDSQEALDILTGIKDSYEKYHGVRILPEAIEAMVNLSVRYIPSRKLPDKAIDLMDKGCVAVKLSTISRHETAPFLGKENRCRNSEAIYEKILTPDIINDLVSRETGIPLGEIKEKERETVLNLAELIKRRVIGQNEAVETVANVIRSSRAGLKDLTKPVAVFLFLGPTGVGKTELAKSLAEVLFGSENALIRVDMTEYMEKHNLARLIGAPPGYAGYENGGQVTEALRKKPYAVVLLDEIEKAHPDIWNLFLQVFDEGRLTDGQGRTIDAKHAIFIMTSNLINTRCPRSIGFGPQRCDLKKERDKSALDKIKETFGPEFINRIDEVILFRSLEKKELTDLVEKTLQKLAAQLILKEITISHGMETWEFLAQKGYDPVYGARQLKRVINQLVEIPLSEMIYKESLHPGDRIEINVSGDRVFFKKDYSTR